MFDFIYLMRYIIIIHILRNKCYSVIIYWCVLYFNIIIQYEFIFGATFQVQ